MIDRDIHLARALLVEGNALLRSVAAAQLRQAGVVHIAQVSRVKDARVLIEREPFDIILCNREFEEGPDSGQDLLDELRREHQLPHSTVFLMVTSQASYLQVMEAAESLLDGLLVRPYNADELGRRLAEARRRKRTLGSILLALDQGRHDVALAQAMARFRKRQTYAVYCGRLSAELLLAQNRPQEAAALFQVLAREPRASTWARLGQARAQIAAGDEGRARQMLAGVLTDEPTCADAHDLLGRIHVERCDFDHALQAYEQAARLTPGCLLRNQHAGALAFYQGRRDEALLLLGRALELGVQSKLFDALTLLMVAILRFDLADIAGFTEMHHQLARFRQRHTQSVRLQRLDIAATALQHLQTGAHADALQTARALGEQAGQDDFDFEAACVLLALWARVPVAAARPDEHAAVWQGIAQRFCVSRASTELLLALAGRGERAAEIIRSTHARIGEIVEAAVERALVSEPLDAARGLLSEGEATLNAKLLQVAGAIASRHGAASDDARQLQDRAAAVLRRSCKASNHIAGIQRSGRSPGALQLRGRIRAETAHAAA